MTGFTAIPLEDDENAHQKFKGVSRIRGPAWAHLPTLTIGFLGVQVFWSVEMSYGLCNPSNLCLSFFKKFFPPLV